MFSLSTLASKLKEVLKLFSSSTHGLENSVSKITRSLVFLTVLELQLKSRRDILKHPLLCLLRAITQIWSLSMTALMVLVSIMLGICLLLLSTPNNIIKLFKVIWILVFCLLIRKQSEKELVK